jgi:nitrogen fixation protein FixH
MARFKAKYIPYLFVLFVILYVSLDCFFVYLASSTYSGPYTSRAFQKGLDFDKINKESMALDDLGWQVEAKYRSSTLMVVAKDKAGKDIKDAVVLVKVVRPVTDKYDQVLELTYEDGKYLATYLFPQKGVWELRVKIKKDDIEYIKTFRVFVSGLVPEF